MKLDSQALKELQLKQNNIRNQYNKNYNKISKYSHKNKNADLI